MDRDEDNDMVRQGTHKELQSLEPEVTTCPGKEARSKDLLVSLLQIQDLQSNNMLSFTVCFFFPQVKGAV